MDTMFEIILSILSLVLLIITTCAKKKKPPIMTPENQKHPVHQYQYSGETSPWEKQETEKANKKNVQNATISVEKRAPGPCTVKMLMIGAGNPYPDYINEEIKDKCDGKLIKMKDDVAMDYHEKIDNAQSKNDARSSIGQVKEDSLSSKDPNLKTISSNNPLNNWILHPPVKHDEQETEIDDDSTKSRTATKKIKKRSSKALTANVSNTKQSQRTIGKTKNSTRTVYAKSRIEFDTTNDGTTPVGKTPARNSKPTMINNTLRKPVPVTQVQTTKSVIKIPVQKTSSVMRNDPPNATVPGTPVQKTNSAKNNDPANNTVASTPTQKTPTPVHDNVSSTNTQMETMTNTPSPNTPSQITPNQNTPVTTEPSVGNAPSTPEV